jgi:hypothetical protein
MRHNPILSETDAFRATMATVGLVVVSGVLGWLTAPAIGVAVFAVVGISALAAYMYAPERGRRLPLRKAAHEHHPHAWPGRRHVIVVANEPLAGEELDAHIRGVHGATVELDILAPILVSRTHLAYTDIDHGLHEARERLAHSLEWARERGFLARGEVGDPSPTTALEDALRDFGADEVIVVTCNSEPARRQEQTELERLREELDVPVVQVSMASSAPGGNRTRGLRFESCRLKPAFGLVEPFQPIRYVPKQDQICALRDTFRDTLSVSGEDMHPCQPVHRRALGSQLPAIRPVTPERCDSLENHS